MRGDLFLVGSYGHTGFTGTSIWIDPFTKTYIVLLTNRVHPTSKTSVTDLRSEVASAAAASLTDLDVDRLRVTALGLQSLAKGQGLEGQLFRLGKPPFE